MEQSTQDTYACPGGIGPWRDVVLFVLFRKPLLSCEITEMKPGERIRLITEVADSLLKRPWPEAQLTLEQFGFSTYYFETYQDIDERSYFIDQVKTGEDQRLADLHTYLIGGDADPSREEDSDTPWDNRSVKLFFSHKYEDRVFVSEVKRILELFYDFDTFVAHNDIEPNEIWRNVIKSALSTCNVLVALLHPDFHSSQWCDQEVGWALGRDIPVAAVRRDSEVRTQDGFLEERQDIALGTDQRNPEGFLAWKIFLLVLNDPRTHERGLHALAEAFVNSFSYANTRALWPLIEQEPRWESEQLRRFEYAVETNPQVYAANVNSTLVPVLVKALIHKFEPSIPLGKEKDPWNPEPPF